MEAEQAILVTGAAIPIVHERVLQGEALDFFCWGRGGGLAAAVVAEEPRGLRCGAALWRQSDAEQV